MFRPRLKAVDQLVNSAKSWFSDWLTRQQRIRHRRLRVMPLEDRRLPDASFALVGGVLTLSGFDAGDTLSIAFDQNAEQYQFTLESGIWDSNDLAGGPFQFLGDSGTLGVNAAYLDGITIDATAMPLAAIQDSDSGFATAALEIRGGGHVQLDSANNDFDVVSVTADSLVLSDRDDIRIGQLSTSGDAQITAVGQLHDVFGATIVVGGNARLTASEILLGNDAADDVRLGSLTFSASGLVEITETDEIILAGENSSLSVILRTDQSLTDNAGTTLRVDGIAEFYAAEIHLGDNASDILELNRLRFVATEDVVIHQDSTIRLLDGSTGQSVSLRTDGSIESAVLSTLVVISANDLSLEANGQIGAVNLPLRIDVDSLTTDTSISGGDQSLSVVGDVETGIMNAGTGTVRFSDGQFILMDTITCSELQLGAGAMLFGNGSVNATLVAESGSVVSPGLSPGRLFSGDVNLTSGSTFTVDIQGPTAGTEYDQLVVTGTVALGGMLSVDLDPVFTPSSGTTFILIDNDSTEAVIGTFQGLPEGSVLTINGQAFVISYIGGDGNDVVLSAGVPEYQFTETSYTFSEGDSGLAVVNGILLTRSGNTAIASSVDITVWAAPGDTATPGEDFTAESFTVYFAAGETSAQVPVQIVGDLTFEADETFTVSMTAFSSGGQAVQNATSTQVIIQNDDTAILVQVINGDLVVTDETPSGGDSRLLIRFDSATAEIVLQSSAEDLGTGDAQSTNEVRISSALITGDIIFDLRGGDDVLTVDFSDGSPLTGTGLIYDGGTENLGDGLAVIGNTISTAVYRPDVAQTGNGIITVDGQQIQFSGLEPVDISGMAHVILELPGADDLITVSNGTDFFAGGLNEALRVSGTSDGTAIETAALWNNTLVTIDTTDTDGTDQITIISADNGHNNQSLTINTGGNADQILIQGSIALDGSLQLQSAIILIDAPSITTGAMQSYAGAVELAQTTTLTAASVVFGGTVDSSPGEQHLLQIVGNAVFEQSVGATDRLLGITVSGGDVEFQQSVAVGAAGLDLTVDSLVFSGAVNSISGGSVSIANTGLVSIASSAPFSLDGAFQQNGPGLVQLASGISTTGNSISFASTVTLLADVLLDTTLSGMNTGAGISLTDIEGSGFQLSLDGGTGGEIQANAIANISTLLISNSGNTLVQGTLGVGILQIDSTSGTVTIEGAITAEAIVTAVQPYALILAGGGLVSASTSFVNTGGVTLGNSDDDVIVFTNGLTSTASTNTLQGTVATEGTDITLGVTNLNSMVRLSTGDSGGNITAGQINGAAASLELNAGTGSIEITNAANVIGDLVVTAAQIWIVEADNITQGAAWNIIGQTTLDAQTFDILLSAAGNEFGQIDAQGRNISIVESADMDLGLVAAAGNVLLESTGSIFDANGDVLNVTSTSGVVRLQAGQNIGVAGADVLTTQSTDAIEVSAVELQIVAGGEAAIEVTNSVQISELSGDTIFLTGSADLDLTNSNPAVRNLSLLASDGTIILPGMLTVSGDLRLEASDVVAAGTLRIAAQRTLFKSLQSATIELNALLRDASGLPGATGTNSGQLDAQVGGDLVLNSIGPMLELADLDGDGTAISIGGQLFSLQATGNVTQVLPIDALQNSRIVSQQLELLGAADFDLSNPQNNVDILAASIDGSLIYTDSDELIIGTVGTTVGITTTDDILVRSVGDLRINNSVIAADGIEDVTEATGEIIRLESVDGNITIDGTGGAVVISTDENPLQSNPLTGDRIVLSADSDRSWTGDPENVPPDQIPEGRITVLGDVTISTDGGVARRFGPRPVPGASGTAFFVFVSGPLPVAVDNAALGETGGGAFLNAFAVEVGVAGEQNLEVLIDWLDPVDEFGILNDAAIQDIAASFGIDNAVSSQRIQSFLVADGGQLNLVGHVYTILDYTLFQTLQNRTTIPVVFAVSHHSSMQLDGAFIEQAGFIQSVPGRDLTSTDNALTPPPAFENGYAEFNIPTLTLTPAPVGFFRTEVVLRTDVVDVVVPPEVRIVPDVRLVGDIDTGTVGGSVFSTKVFLQIRRQFEVDGPAEIVIERITDSNLISSRDAFEQFVRNNPELQDGSGYEIWLITETRGQTVERPIVEFEITGGRPGPAQDSPLDDSNAPQLHEVPFEQPADAAQEISVDPPPELPLEVPLEPQLQTQLQSTAVYQSMLTDSASVLLMGTAVRRFRRATHTTEPDDVIRRTMTRTGRFRRHQHLAMTPTAGER